MVEKTAAAFAFGISVERLEKLAEQSKSLVISPLGEGKVKIGLVETAVVWQRDLWKEMLNSLEKGRSEASSVRKAYFGLAMKLQQGLSREWEEDSDFLQLVLSVLWEQLPGGTQKTLETISPDRVRSNVGVAGSME